MPKKKRRDKADWNYKGRRQSTDWDSQLKQSGQSGKKAWLSRQKEITEDLDSQQDTSGYKTEDGSIREEPSNLLNSPLPGALAPSNVSSMNPTSLVRRSDTSDYVDLFNEESQFKRQVKGKNVFEGGLEFVSLAEDNTTELFKFPSKRALSGYWEVIRLDTFVDSTEIEIFSEHTWKDRYQKTIIFTDFQDGSDVILRVRRAQYLPPDFWRYMIGRGFWLPARPWDTNVTFPPNTLPTNTNPPPGIKTHPDFIAIKYPPIYSAPIFYPETIDPDTGNVIPAYYRRDITWKDGSPIEDGIAQYRTTNVPGLGNIQDKFEIQDLDFLRTFLPAPPLVYQEDIILDGQPLKVRVPWVYEKNPGSSLTSPTRIYTNYSINLCPWDDVQDVSPPGKIFANRNHPASQAFNPEITYREDYFTPPADPLYSRYLYGQDYSSSELIVIPKFIATGNPNNLRSISIGEIRYGTGNPPPVYDCWFQVDNITATVDDKPAIDITLFGTGARQWLIKSDEDFGYNTLSYPPPSNQ